MKLTSVEMTLVFAKDHKPDFETLKARGWENPLGIRDEPLEECLVKNVNGMRCFFVCHPMLRGDDHIMQLHISDEDTPEISRKGEGVAFNLDRLLETIRLVDRELEACEGDDF